MFNGLPCWQLVSLSISQAPSIFVPQCFSGIVSSVSTCLQRAFVLTSFAACFPLMFPSEVVLFQNLPRLLAPRIPLPIDRVLFQCRFLVPSWSHGSHFACQTYLASSNFRPYVSCIVSSFSSPSAHNSMLSHTLFFLTIPHQNSSHQHTSSKLGYVIIPHSTRSQLIIFAPALWGLFRAHDCLSYLATLHSSSLSYLVIQHHTSSDLITPHYASLHLFIPGQF